MKTAHKGDSAFIQFEKQVDVDGVMSLPARFPKAVMNFWRGLCPPTVKLIREPCFPEKGAFYDIVRVLTASFLKIIQFLLTSR